MVKQIDIPNDFGNSYPLRESIGWLWRNIFGVRRANPCGILPLPQDVVMNAIHPRIRIGFVGDIMPLGRKVLNISSGVRLFFQDCDYLVGNMEGTITTAVKSRLDAQRHGPSILDALVALFPADRTFLSVANNHAGDFPVTVFRQSVKCLQDHGFHVFGLREEPYAEIDGSVSILGASMWSNRPCREISYLDALGRSNPPGAFCIAYPHWGYELETFPRPEIVQTGGRLLQSYSAVLGHHSHVPQPFTENHQDNTIKLLSYSLGNFCTGIRIKKFQYGTVCKVDIGPGEDKIWHIGAVRWRYTRVRHITAGAMNIAFAPTLSL